MQSIKATEFDDEVLNATDPVLVDFWSPFCGPCIMMNEVLEGLVEEIPNVKIVKVNVDEEVLLANEQKILVMPTLKVFNQGECAKEILGLQTPEDIIAAIKNLELS